MNVSGQVYTCPICFSWSVSLWDKLCDSCKIQDLILPKLQLGLEAARKSSNRFNGLSRSTRIVRKALKRFEDPLQARIPKLKRLCQNSELKNHKDTKTPKHELEKYFQQFKFVTSRLGDLVTFVGAALRGRPALLTS